MKNRTKISKHHFNLFEIVIALGVAIIGMVGIMALFPVGLNASRNSIAESYTSQAADQLLHQIKAQVKMDWSTLNTYAAIHAPANIESTWKDDGNWTSIDSTGTLFKHTTDVGKYKIIRYTDLNSDGVFNDDTDTIDYECVVRVWQTETPGSGDPNHNFSASLNLEVRWPSDIPFDKRQTSSYYLEVFRR